MQIIIPMSGVGQRFVNAGYQNPKPLIKVHSKPIIEYVVNLFPHENDFLFICSNDHLGTAPLKTVLETLRPQSRVVGIDSHNLGPVYSISQVANHVKDDQPITVSYCDFNMNWNYPEFKKTVLENNYAAAIPAYTGFHPHLLNPDNVYAGMLVDGNNLMRDIKEKHCFTKSPMNCHHSAGIYYFCEGREMLKYFDELLDENINLNGEYYASLPFYLYLRDQRRVHVPLAKHFMQWGTPEDLEEYLAWASLFLNDNDLSEVPSGRQKNVKIPYPENSDEYQKSYEYWEDYFNNYFE